MSGGISDPFYSYVYAPGSYVSQAGIRTAKVNTLPTYDTVFHNFTAGSDVWREFCIACFLLTNDCG